MSQFNQQFIILIIDRYGLELEDDLIDNIVATWMGQYDRGWIVKAIVESLHRGRYKIKSVDSILSGWQRSGKPSYNFPPEFEREILQDLPTMSDLVETPAPPTLSQLDDFDPGIQFPGLSSDQLNPAESAPFPHHDCYRSGASPFSSRRYANGKASPTTRRKPPSCVRQDRQQSVRATPILQPPTLERGTTSPPTEIVDVDTASAVPNGRLPPTAEADLQDHRSFRSEPPSVVSFKGEDDLNLNHINSHSKFQLFHTLRAIITPNNLQAIEFDDDDLDPLISYSTDLA
jgi:hypothetical protein